MFPPLLFFSSLMTSVMMSGGLIVTLFFGMTQSMVLVEVELWSIASMSFPLAILFDVYSLVFLSAVTLITLSVLSFSYSYMGSSSGFSKFHLLVITFVASMIILILSPNLVTLMLGWDGLGISSFFLVIFYKSNKAFNAGLLTALTNRLGDALILISFTILWSFPSFTISLASLSSLTTSQFMVFILIIAASTKSAQVPFSAWLPAAMAAPTPVSALVHSSTLVTAGVYLLFRLAPMFKFSKLFLLVGALGAVTSIMASFAALLEADLKKIVALSTLSQLGVMVLSLSLGLPVLAFFHLVVHAFFKALLFIATGNIIHNSNDYQDLRRNGGSAQVLPFTQATVILTKLSLCGLPFFSAFYSKEWVLEGLSSGSQVNLWVCFMMWAGVGLTALYSLRFIYYTIQHSRLSSLFWKEDTDISINLAKILLVIPSVMAGKLLLPCLADFLLFPAVSFISKLFVLSLLFIVAPLLFTWLSFSPFFSLLKSMFYLFFLSSWSGSGPLSLLSHTSFSLNWSSSFGWKDYLSSSGLFLMAKNSTPWVFFSSSSFLKAMAVVVLVFSLWIF